jgi:hypothetical protein
VGSGIHDRPRCIRLADLGRRQASASALSCSGNTWAKPFSFIGQRGILITLPMRRSSRP